MTNLNTPLIPELSVLGSLWTLNADVNGYKQPFGSSLTTQAKKGRTFQLLDIEGNRVLTKLMEDSYRCWIDIDALHGKAVICHSWKPLLLSKDEIEKRLPAVLHWSEQAEQCSNNYLWGGTTEPNMDCSGFVQMAFASEGIWIPRDAYQQELFCQPIATQENQLELLRPGDLVFFGSQRRCSHVGLYIGNGQYRHSSGVENGRNGIGVDSLYSCVAHPVSRYYRKKLRGAGRLIRCHDGRPLT